MGDHQHGLALHQRLEGLLYLRLVLRVCKGACLIQHHDGRVLQKRPGQRDALHLAAGEVHALGADHGVQPTRRLFQNIAALSKLRRV